MNATHTKQFERTLWAYYMAGGISHARLLEILRRIRARELLEERRWRLMHSYGGSQFQDGLVTEKIREIDAALSGADAKEGEPT